MTQGIVKNRFVLVNVQLQETFLKGAWLVQRAETATRDYHVQVRSTDFEIVWVLSSTQMLLLLLLPHPYHCREGNPPSFYQIKVWTWSHNCRGKGVVLQLYEKGDYTT
jgi:hypothetical protein